MKFLICVLMVLLNSWWRRWFGGGFKNTWLGNKRGVQCIVYLLFTTAVAYLIGPLTIWWHNLIFALVFAGYSYVQFWSRFHGAFFDIGRDTNPNIPRYNEHWQHYVCDWICGDHKYGFLYDFIYMALRYTLPTVTLFVLGFAPCWFGVGGHLLSYHIIVIGALISPIYAFCWTLFEREHWLFEKHWSVAGPTNLAEYLAGAVWGFWVLCVI